MEGVINMLVEGWDEILKGMPRRVVKQYKHAAAVYVEYALGMCLSSHVLTVCYGYPES